MASNHKKAVLKTIQLNEFMKPCAVLETICEDPHYSSYLVSMAMPDGAEALRFLQVFPSDQTEECRRTKDRLQLHLGSDQVRQISGFDGVNYLAIDLPSSQRLRWRTVLQQPLARRLEIFAQLGQHLAGLESQGILPDGIDLHTLILQPDGGICSWDLHNAIFIEGAAEEEILRCRRSCAADLARLILQALIGKAVRNANCLTQLKLALHGQMEIADQEELLQLLDDYLYDENRTDPAPLLEAVELVAMSLEMYEPKSTQYSDTTLAAANFLRRHPLWKYVRTGKDGRKQLNILLVGVSPMRKAFLDTILPCAQMLDTQMHIRIVSRDAAAFCDRYLKKAPLLAQTASITHIPERPNRTYFLNELLTGKDRQGNPSPLACLTFEKANLPDPAALQAFDAGCILLMEECTEPMRRALMALSAGNRRPLLIGFKDPVPRLNSLRKLNSRTVLDSFAKISGVDLTKSKIYREALTVHTFYTKQYNERAAQQDILAEFQDKYNRDSSIRSALSIPYKLAAYDLDHCEDASIRFADEVLTQDDRLRRLIWLEHRSWQAHLIVNGWTLDTDRFEEDVIAHHYKHKANPWHACLFGSHDTRDEPLADWSVDDWEQRSTTGLDPLDKMSVDLHRILAGYVKATVEPELEKQLRKLSTCLSLTDYQQLQSAVLALQANVTNAAVSWKRVLRDLRQSIGEEDTKTANAAREALAIVAAQAAFIQKRNECTQYKDFDRAIIEAIPYLREKDSIRCIYKLWSEQEHPWSNLASSFFLEPAELCLLTTEGQTVSQARQAEFLSFLQERRHIDITLRILPLKELQKVRKGSVLDVTGVDTAQLLAAIGQLSEIKASLPMIHYKDGKLQALDSFPLLRFYRYNQTLTVEEMMAVTGTVVRSENELVPMQQMEHYEELWQVSQVLHSYNTICDFLSFHKQVWKVLPYRSAAPWKPHCNKNDASAKGWLPLLVSLEDARVIEPIRWNQFPVLVKASDPRCQDSLNRMLDAYCNADVNTRRQLKLSFKSEDPDAVCVLENLNLTFDKTLPVQERNQVYQLSFSADGPRYLTLPEFATGLQELHKSGLIHHINQDPFLTNTHIQPGNVPAVHIRFRYADLGAMDCLTKAGNALEALAYHTIRKMDVFDDVKLGVSILWGEQIEPGTPTQNEIDLVCIKGNRSFFISCKKTRKILPAHITEIRYETDRFGVNGTAILLTTAPENSNKAAYNRAKRMGVEIITLRDDGTQDSARELRRQIKLILKKYCM